MYQIEKMGSRQLGSRLEDGLMEYILGTPVEIGQKIPNEFELAQQFGVGRSTVREAVKALVTRGILEVRRGSGTFVISHRSLEDDPLGLNRLEDKYKLALELFDVMKKNHGLSDRDRLLLRIASIIHGCGKFISTRNVSASAYSIIMATEIIGLSHEERQLVAEVVRSYEEEFDYVDDDTRVAKLTALLRLANSLDRTHKQKMAECRMTVKNGELVIAASYDGDMSMELFAVDMCADFFEEIFGIRPVLKKKRRG